MGIPKSNLGVAPFKFAPFSVKQKKVLTWWMEQSPYKDWDMIIADGSIRSGKTVSMVDAFFTWAQDNFSGENFILAGKTISTLKRNVLDVAFKIFAAKGIAYRYNRSESYITIGSNTYYCFGANTEASQDVLQGLTAAGAYADEAALFPQSFVEQMIGRCSVEGAKIWMNCNPEGPNHYLKTDYIDQAKKKKILHLHFTLDDNLALPESTKNRYKRMFTGLFYKRYVLGMWVMAEGSIYDMWDEDSHVIECRNNQYKQYIVAVDYGTANPCTFGMYGIGEDVIDVETKTKLGPAVNLKKEYYYDSRKVGKQKTDSEYADDFMEFIKPEQSRLTVVYIDPSAASFITELKKRLRPLGIRIKAAKNDVLDGIRTVATMLANGRYKVDKKCKATRDEYPGYVWDPKAQEKGKDEPLKVNDHAMDRDRYALFSHFGKPLPIAVGKGGMA